jgi:hypothetical protein
MKVIIVISSVMLSSVAANMPQGSVVVSAEEFKKSAPSEMVLSYEPIIFEDVDFVFSVQVEVPMVKAQIPLHERFNSVNLVSADVRIRGSP